MAHQCSVRAHRDSPLVNVFVYGTLMPGQVSYALCASAVVEIYPAIAIATLYHLPLGYPAIVPDLSARNGLSSTTPNKVHGVVLTFADPAILQRLDDYEQHDPQTFAQQAPSQNLAAHQYQRVELAVFTPTSAPLGLAWGYVMNPVQIERLGGIQLPGGRWDRAVT